jgi:hypothetical protein
MRRVVVDHIVEGLTSGSTSAVFHARALQTEMDLAGVSVDAEVKAALAVADAMRGGAS